VKNKLILEVLNIEGIERKLERLADLLTKIQKALGEYLEKQRAAFPRFYFIGDEDLLEIIGNSRDLYLLCFVFFFFGFDLMSYCCFKTSEVKYPHSHIVVFFFLVILSISLSLKLQKHLKKMFAGISAMILDETQSIIKGMASSEGETVLFKKQITIKDFSTIDGWLKAFESEMKNTLASLLQQSLKELEEARALMTNESDYMNFYLNWIEKYPAQLVVLTTQIMWSQSVESVLSALQTSTNLKVIFDLSLFLLIRKDSLHLIFVYLYGGSFGVFVCV
jgi:dynein heavy chain 1